MHTHSRCFVPILRRKVEVRQIWYHTFIHHTQQRRNEMYDLVHDIATDLRTRPVLYLKCYMCPVHSSADRSKIHSLSLGSSSTLPSSVTLSIHSRTSTMCLDVDNKFNVPLEDHLDVVFGEQKAVPDRAVIFCVRRTVFVEFAASLSASTHCLSSGLTYMNTSGR